MYSSFSHLLVLSKRSQGFPHLLQANQSQDLRFLPELGEKPYAFSFRGISQCHYFVLSELPSRDKILSFRAQLEKTLPDREILVIPRLLSPAKPSFFAFDMDSTLIQQEVIDELAREHGVYDLVAKITNQAMEGGLDFDTALRERVKALAGLTQTAMDNVYYRIEKNPGVNDLIELLRNRGAKIAVYSGGFTPILQRFQKENGIDRIEANDLVIQDGLYTGEIIGRIVNREAKASYFQAHRAEWGIEPEQSIAVGDGANDASMLSSAGIGIGFHAKQGLKDKVSNWIDHLPLDVLDFVFEDRLELL